MCLEIFLEQSMNIGRAIALDEAQKLCDMINFRYLVTFYAHLLLVYERIRCS